MCTVSAAKTEDILFVSTGFGSALLFSAVAHATYKLGLVGSFSWSCSRSRRSRVEIRRDDVQEESEMQAPERLRLAFELFSARLGGLRAPLVEKGPAEDGAAHLRGGGAVVPFGGAADAADAHQRGVSGVPCGAHARAALAEPGHCCLWRAGG